MRLTSSLPALLLLPLLVFITGWQKEKKRRIAVAVAHALKSPRTRCGPCVRIVTTRHSTPINLGPNFYSRMRGPRLTMDSNGNIVLDQTSLMVDRVEGEDERQLENAKDALNTPLNITSASCMSFSISSSSLLLFLLSLHLLLSHKY